VDFKAGHDILEGAPGGFIMGIEFVDMILQALNPSLLLSNTQAALFLATVDKLCNFIGQPFVLHEAGVREGGADGGDDGKGEGSCIYRWPCWSIRYGGGVEEIGASLDKMCFSGDGKQGSHMLLLSVVTSFLSDVEELRILGAVLSPPVATQYLSAR